MSIARKVVIVLMLSALFCTAAVSVAAAGPGEQADLYYSLRKDMGNVRKGIELLEQELAKNPADYELLWRQARFYWFMGDRADGKERLAFFEKGKGYAEKAAEANDQGIDGQYWLAASIGSVGIERGIMASLFMVPSMKKALEKCIKIDPKHGGSRYLYARLLWQVPGIAGGNVKKALEEAKLAVLYDPEEISHWLALGQISAANKDYKGARTALEKAVSMPDDPEDPVGSQKDREDARAELKKIEGK
ncbi:MAG TPA: hypothetical protein PKK63_06735 [Bacillota bacterium]|nr:MAG: hypothetical protein BWY00_00162 [Firmicutes bacterium ADurb.Bin153]HNV35211.1 hypothetical protein [Bacillota bacterium]